MPAGYDGRLLSESFLDQLLSTGALPRDTAGDHLRLHRWRSRHDGLGPASALRTVFETAALPLVDILGFERPTHIQQTTAGIVATLQHHRAQVVLIVTAWGERLDPWWRVAVVESQMRAASWCLLFNGTHLRLVAGDRVYSRRHAEFDIDVALDDECGVAAMWGLLNATALCGGASTASAATLVAASDRYATSVCDSLRIGVLDASRHVLGALARRAAPADTDAAFDQALTIVYRILFLLFAEARALVPLWHPVYRESYSMEALRSGRVPAAGLWDAFRAISRLAHGGCLAGDLRMTGFNGRLFAPSRTPLVERHDLDPEAARLALVALSTCPAADGEGRQPIAYRDLGVEQLGSVYETLLDYTPRITPIRGRREQRGSADVSLEPGSGLRKGTGTFYTPQPIAAYVIRRTLEPLVRDAAPEQILALKVLDPSMGSGAFLVGACTYLAHAYENSLIRSGRCRPGDFGPRDHAMIRRTIAERCLFGVDSNPMAVQLARLSLWLATLAADRPLSFLDHHLQTGDSLVGAWLSSLRRPPASRRRRVMELPLFAELTVDAALREALPVRFTLAESPTDTVEQARAKERALAALTSRTTTLARWRRVADLWCGRWFADAANSPPKLFAVLADAVLSGNPALPPAVVDRHLREADAIAASRRFFHWELEFPEVFFDASGGRRTDGGFDAVIGNPPWDMVRADSGPSRTRTESKAGVSALLRFSRDSGVYADQSTGHANRYQLFTERAIALTRAGGRIGLVLPAGIATDHGSARLRRLLFSRCGIDSMVGFHNRRGVFPIHRSVRFVLMTGTNGERTSEIACRFGETDPSTLESCGDLPAATDPWFPVRLTPALIARLSGDTLTVPDFQSPLDVGIAERAASLFPPLGSAAHWAARFGRELNASDDRHLFRRADRGLPIVEGRQLQPFRVRLEGARYAVAERDAERLLGVRHGRFRLAYRDVASPTNRVTLIAAILPPRCVSTHTVFCLQTPVRRRAQYFLCGLFNSLVVNYLVRLRVSIHVTTAIVEQLPIPAEDQAGDTFDEIATLARRLEARDEAASASMLDARIARMYQLTAEEFGHVLATFPLVAREHRDEALRVFKRL